MAFIDCNEQNTTTRRERPHCEHGEWGSNGNGTWRSPTYITWHSVLDRTRYRRDRRQDATYKGVEVEWNSFQEFRDAMGPRPSRDHTIDRIDPEGHYTTENCQWLLAHLNYSKGGRNSARQSSAAMIARMEAELQDLENELLEEGIKVE